MMYSDLKIKHRALVLTLRLFLIYLTILFWTFLITSTWHEVLDDESTTIIALSFYLFLALLELLLGLAIAASIMVLPDAVAMMIKETYEQ
jgi:uncharacterized membrane protein